jgi:prevent-host-death family protein
MQKMIGVTDLQRRFKTVFDEVVHDGVPYVLARGSRPEAALIPYDEFLKYQRWRENLLTEFDEWRARQAAFSEQFDEDEVAADVEAAIREVRDAKSGTN